MRIAPLTLTLALTALLVLPACGGGDGIGLPIAFPPTITSVSPSGGPTTGGTTISVGGTNFPTLIVVSVGGNLCLNIVVQSPTSLTCNVPPGTEGAKSVQVSTATGNDTLAGAFTYFLPSSKLPSDVAPIVDVTLLDARGSPVGLLSDVLHQENTPEVVCGDEPFSAFAPLVDGLFSPDLHEVGAYYFGLDPESGAVFWYSNAASLALGDFPDGWCVDTRVTDAVSIELLSR